MSRVFVGTSSQRLLVTSTPVTGPPFTMACWGFMTSATTQQCLVSIQSGANDRHTLTNDISARVSANSTVALTSVSSVTATNSIVANTWFHAAGVYTASNDRLAYFNGTAGTTDISSSTPSGIAQVMIGARTSSGTPGLFLTGRVAEVGIWNEALTAAEILALAQRASPLLIRPNALVGYWPLGGIFGDSDTCFINSTYNLTPTGSPTFAAHPAGTTTTPSNPTPVYPEYIHGLQMDPYFKQTWIKIGGVWKKGTINIKQGGVWKVGDPKIKISGSWR